MCHYFTRTHITIIVKSIQAWTTIKIFPILARTYIYTRCNVYTSVYNYVYVRLTNTLICLYVAKKKQTIYIEEHILCTKATRGETKQITLYFRRNVLCFYLGIWRIGWMLRRIVSIIVFLAASGRILYAGTDRDRRRNV